MTSVEQSLENVIKKNFPNEIQQKRVKKGWFIAIYLLSILSEIQTLRELNQKWYKISLQSTNLGLKVIVCTLSNIFSQNLLFLYTFCQDLNIIFDRLKLPKNT